MLLTAGGVAGISFQPFCLWDVQNYDVIFEGERLLRTNLSLSFLVVVLDSLHYAS